MIAMSRERAPTRVAVITRTKNRPILLNRAAVSVSNQSFKNLHWVVVNDGGRPEPVDQIVARARADGIATTVFHNPQSLGMEAASNLGIREADAEYLVIHDDDDSWEPDFLEATTAFLDTNTQYGGVITHSTKVIEEIDGQSVNILSTEPYNGDLSGVYLIDLAVVNRVPPISFVFRKTLYDELGGFNEELPVLGDWDFHLRFSCRADIGLIPLALANYHHRLNVSGENTVYGNSVVEGTDQHKKYDTWLRNKWLREDLDSGRFGIGMMVGLAHLNKGLYRSLQPLIIITNILIKIKRTLDVRRWFRK